MTTTFSFADFHDATAANFQPCELPSRPADFTSASGSRYWDEGDRVVRASDHWCRGIRSCDWFFAGEERREELVGACPYKDFAGRLDATYRALPADELPAALAAIYARLDAEAEAHWQAHQARRAAEEALKQPGQKVRCLRKTTLKTGRRSFETIEETVVFTIKKITRAFVIGAGGEKFGLSTLSQWEAA